MEVKLVYGEQARLWAGVTTKNIRAYELCMEALDYYHRFTKQDIVKGIQCAEMSISLDKDYPFPYVVLGLCHWVNLHGNWSESPLESFSKMEACAERAMSLTDVFDMTYNLMGLIELIRRNHGKAIEYEQKALELNPNAASALISLAYVLAWAGRTDEAIRYAKRANRFNPLPQTGYYVGLAMSLRMDGQYKEAIDVCKKLISLNPHSMVGYSIMTIAYSLLKDYDKARKLAKEVLRRYPSYSIDLMKMMAPFKHEAALNEAVDALRKAGIPEHSPE